MRLPSPYFVAFAAAIFSGPLHGAPRVKHINPPTLHSPTGYTHVVEATGRRTVYVSGQIALDRSGAVVGTGDLTQRAASFRSSALPAPSS